MQNIIEQYQATEHNGIYIIRPGRGMLRRLRLLAEATGTHCEAVSRRGKTIASCNPGYYAEMTWSGTGMYVPHFGSWRFDTPRSGALRKTSCKASGSEIRRRAARASRQIAPIVRLPPLPGMPLTYPGDVDGEHMPALARIVNESLKGV